MSCMLSLSLISATVSFAIAPILPHRERIDKIAYGGSLRLGTDDYATLHIHIDTDSRPIITANVTITRR